MFCLQRSWSAPTFATSCEPNNLTICACALESGLKWLHRYRESTTDAWSGMSIALYCRGRFRAFCNRNERSLEWKGSWARQRDWPLDLVSRLQSTNYQLSSTANLCCSAMRKCNNVNWGLCLRHILPRILNSVTDKRSGVEVLFDITEGLLWITSTYNAGLLETMSPVDTESSAAPFPHSYILRPTYSPASTLLSP